MQKGFRQSMRWLHTWSGLIVGWLLFVIFVTGTSSYYKDEINLWMKPELYQSIASSESMSIAQKRALEVLKETESLNVSLPNSRSNTISMMWMEDIPAKEGERRHRHKRVYKYYDASSGELIEPRATAGGNFLYRFHFELHSLPRELARWIVGIATMCMFVAIITGVIIHKRIFKDIFTFRREKGIRSWMDAHILPAVAALPFLIMITYSGLLLFTRLMMPWGMEVAYGDNFREYREDMNALQVKKELPKGEAEHSLNEQKRDNREFKVGERKRGERESSRVEKISHSNLDENMLFWIIERSKAYYKDGVGGFSISKDRSGDLKVEVRPIESSTIFALRSEKESLVFDGKSGELLEENLPPTSSSSILVANSTFETLHRARFADSTMRFLFLLAGFSGIVLVATGLILWVQKRKHKYEEKKSFGFWLVEKLNIGTIIGLFIAIGVYFLANRFIPATTEDRSSLEVGAFFIAWLISFCHAFIRDNKKAWREQLIFLAILYLSLPIVSAVLYAGSLGYIVNRDSIFIYFDIFFIFMAATFALVLWVLNKIEKKRSLKWQ